MQHRLLAAAAALLLGCHASLPASFAQVSTIGSTAMGLPSTPGAIVTSPLDGPSPFSAVTQPGIPDTTLAPVPLASDPTTPGTVVTCAPPSGLLQSGIPATVPIGSLAAPAISVAAAPGAISAPINSSATGTLLPPSPAGSPSATVCSSTPGGPPANGAALPLSTADIPGNPAPGVIQPPVAQLADTSIDLGMGTDVVPTPNTSACAESVTMSLSTPGMMAPANATGAAATPGVSPAQPPGC